MGKRVETITVTGYLSDLETQEFETFDGPQERTTAKLKGDRADEYGTIVEARGVERGKALRSLMESQNGKPVSFSAAPFAVAYEKAGKMKAFVKLVLVPDPA